MQFHEKTKSKRVRKRTEGKFNDRLMLAGNLRCVIFFCFVTLGTNYEVTKGQERFND